MKTLLILLSLIAASQANAIINLFMEEWNTFKLQYGKVYQSSVEEMLRMKIFVENKIKIAKHNAKYERGEVSYQLGLNRFGDMFPHEFNEIMNGYNHSLQVDLENSLGNKGATFIEPANVEIPSSVDWRKKGAVTEVKYQGKCGSCWAFSATGALEGQYFRKTGVLVSLSEQNLIDCSFWYGNYGCRGGFAHKAFTYIRDNGGIDTEDSYPYKAKVYQCRYDASHKGADDKGYYFLRRGDETQLMKAVATVGPISVAIDASHDSIQFYKTGIYFEPECSSSSINLNHAVLVVGYGTTAYGEDYWLVKNSWSDGWGESGYIRMARNQQNNCGIATEPVYPTV